MKQANITDEQIRTRIEALRNTRPSVIASTEMCDADALEELLLSRERIAQLESEIEQHYWCGYTDGHSRGFCCGKLYGEDSQMAQHRQACYVAYREQIRGE